MAIPKIKATYSLDVATTEKLESIAKALGTSKSAALTRVINEAAEQHLAPELSDPIAALDALQSHTSLSSAEIARWQEKIRAQRRSESPTGGS